MNTTTTHPAIIAHAKGHSRPVATGDDYAAYVVRADRKEYLLTLWSDGRIGLQTV